MSSHDKGPEPSAAVPPPTFEAALNRLEEIVSRLERGEITLDESLSAFQEGTGLVRLCMERINAAETAVRKLTKGDAPDGPRPPDAPRGEPDEV